MSNAENTLNFTLDDVEKEKIKEILKKVFDSLESKGYNPINQISGYLLSGDPAYITSFNNARNLIYQLDRDEIIRHLLREYMFSE